jgi:hypothetical protein
MVDAEGAFEAVVAQVQDDIMTGGIKTSEQEEEIAIKEDFDDFQSKEQEAGKQKRYSSTSLLESNERQKPFW